MGIVTAAFNFDLIVCDESNPVKASITLPKPVIRTISAINIGAGFDAFVRLSHSRGLFYNWIKFSWLLYLSGAAGSESREIILPEDRKVFIELTSVGIQTIQICFGVDDLESAHVETRKKNELTAIKELLNQMTITRVESHDL